MVSVNPLTREIHLKIVYYGPGLGGKTTTLQYIHDVTDPGHRGKMVSLATPVERTLYFDYLPVRLPEIAGYALKLQLFTVPGQIHFNATRKLVLSNADGVVFVADSQRSRLEADLESYDNLLFNLSDYKVDVESFPIVFQYNKRDLADVLPLGTLDRELNRKGHAAFGTSAVKGTNVFEALECITKSVVRAVKKKGVSAHAVPPPSVAASITASTENQGALPLEDAVSKIADRSRSPQPDAGGPSPLAMERPTIPAPLALSEKTGDSARARLANFARQGGATAPRFTFVPLWPESAKKRGMAIETAVCDRRYLDAVRLILAELDLILTIHRRGKEKYSLDTVIALLGLDGGRYKSVATLASASAAEISLADVLHAYLFLMNVIEKSR